MRCERGTRCAPSSTQSRARPAKLTAVAPAFVAMRTQLHAIEGLPATIAEIQNKLDELEASDADSLEGWTEIPRGGRRSSVKTGRS
jgi:hypothetical protein